MSFTIASIVWLVLLIVFIAVEAATTTLVSIWFCAGAAVALLFSAFVPNAVAQTAVFLVVSLLCLVLMRPLVRKKDAKAAVPTNADRNVGQTAEVIAAVEPARPGGHACRVWIGPRAAMCRWLRASWLKW